MTALAGNVKRSAAIRGHRFWIAVLFSDKVLGNVQMSTLTCKMQESEARRILHLAGIQTLLSDDVIKSW